MPLLLSLTLTVRNPMGLHARPLSRVVEVIEKNQAVVSLTYNDQTVDASSILDMLTLCIPCGGLVKFETSSEFQGVLDQLKYLNDQKVL